MAWGDFSCWSIMLVVGLVLLVGYVSLWFTLSRGWQTSNIFGAVQVAVLGVLVVVCCAILPVAPGGIVWGEFIPTVGGEVSWRGALLIACIAPSLSFMLLLSGRSAVVGNAGILGLAVLLGIGFIFVATSSVGLALVAFELLLFVSLYLLRLTSKSERVLEAIVEMFYWTVFGSLGLLLGFSLLLFQGIFTFTTPRVGSSTTLAGLCLLWGFGVKVPCWPCFSWLLKAHVEAATEFSILLSGVVVKFGVFGVYRALILGGEGTDLAHQLLAGVCLLGFVEASLRLLAQRDLKRVVALTTVVEMNWAGFCLALGGAELERVAQFLLIAHGFTTTLEFFAVECIVRRWATRDVACLAGCWAHTPVLWGFVVGVILITLGFPGTALFAAKVSFLYCIFSVSPIMFVGFVVWFFFVLPVIYMRLWLPIWFGQGSTSRGVVDLGTLEVGLFLVGCMACVVLGLWPGVFLVA